MMYQDKMYTPVLFVNDEVARKRDLINFEENNIVIVEDIFGRSNIDFNDDLHRGILDVLYSCMKTESCKSKLIITIRGNDEIERKLNEKHKIFEKEIFINLDKNRRSHTNELILSKHMNKHGISLCKSKKLTDIRAYFYPPEVNQQCKSDVYETNDNSLKKVCVSLFDEICSGKYEMHIGFPQACHLFCSNKNFTKQGKAYFTHASQSLVNEIMNLKTQGFDNKQMQYQYCVLVYTAIKRSIDVDDIDEHCFQNLISYFENNNIRISLLKQAVFKLEGTYLNKIAPDSVCNHHKRQKVSDIYILQHSTIREAILVSFGDDADVLSVCDSWFLFEYIRPKGYKVSPSDNMVYLFTDYKLLAKKLMSILSTDYYSCISVGAYLQNIALLERRDEIIEFFFEIVEDVKPEQYVCLLNGLTSMGTNTDLVKFHPQLCKKIINSGGWIVFLVSCRPIGWSDNNTNFFEIETDMLIEKLILMVALNRSNGNDLISEENERIYHPCSLLSKFLNYQYAVGNYVFENLIAKGFLDIAEILLTNIKQKEQEINPIHIKKILIPLILMNLMLVT
ncbi:unnamed protein product [Mytilus coruscus]|uniref:Uncharacterized protein n=1 Tax=Mytilus coruscus TaxID=42192 RepID=A0A6J8AM02_MYTCO|nr:unnamed protein product [Mytilus coruscus]